MPDARDWAALDAAIPAPPGQPALSALLALPPDAFLAWVHRDHHAHCPCRHGTPTAEETS